MWQLFDKIQLFTFTQFSTNFREKVAKFNNEASSGSQIKNIGSKPPVITTETSQQNNQRNSNQQNSANSQQRREDIRLTKMMLIIFISFVVREMK